MHAIRVEDASQASAAARAAFEVLPKEVFVRTFDNRLADASERNRTTTIVLRTFAVTLLVAVGFVLATLISARVLERAAELGLLKAVGLTPLLITVVVAVELFLLAATAAVAGAILGSCITPLLVRTSSELLDAVPVTVSGFRIVLTVVLVLAVVAASAVVPTLRLARAGVLRSLSSRADAGATNGLARRVPLRSPIPLTLAVKQILARPARSTATAGALALTVASLVAGLAFEATVKHEDALEQQVQQNRPRDPNAEGLAPSQPDPVAIKDSTREQLRPIVHGFNAVLVTVAVINLLVTAIVSLRQRRRDIAVTRAVGLTPAQVQRNVFCSDALVGLAASILGLPLGIAMFLGVYQLVNGNTELAVLPPWWQLIAVPIACVAGVITVIAIPGRNAVRRKITEALQYE
jgi:putative ABC transport system permease protein